MTRLGASSRRAQPLDELDALLRLLDDTDEQVWSAVEPRLIAYGDRVLHRVAPLLTSADPLVRDRVGGIVDAVAALRPAADFAVLRVIEEQYPERASTLAHGCVALARTAYPSYRLESFDDALNRFARTLARRVEQCESDGARLVAVSRYFYGEELFAGNGEDYYHPDNSFVNRVLETRRGLPITLAAILLLVTRRVGLPLAGVNMPGHFLVRYRTAQCDAMLDPFTGQLMTRADAEAMAQRIGVKDLQDALRVPTDGEIVGRMIRNAVAAYTRRNDPLRARILQKCAEVFTEEEE